MTAVSSSASSTCPGTAGSTPSSSTRWCLRGSGRQGIGTRLVEVAVNEARRTDCEWLHVDFDDHLRTFYFEACGFTPTNAGLIKLV
jgi:hypothetical protein